MIITHKAVNCSICNKTYKIECVNISSAEARKIHQRAGLSWSCKNCMDIGNDLNSLKKSIVALQEQIKVLKETISATKTTIIPTANTNALLEIEQSIQEISERDKRKCNIIIYGLKEANNMSKQQQIAADANIVQKLTTDLQISESSSPVRLGKYDPSKDSQMRPIQITLNSAEAAFTAIGNFIKLRSSNKWTNVSISRDRTPMQIKLFKAVKEDLKRRTDNGENGLKIIHRNGIPTIVSTEN
ncbi:hypothetical protein Zmor_023982 [Zophobas morio]|uniref:Uncharacterized protein n=1 Tax=Zophobas morio TaxID=2755281 RepID=A0AA38I239_9CUCU|nr:hypothetical protein Zmor_023982 [Zophobas morio]